MGAQAPVRWRFHNLLGLPLCSRGAAHQDIPMKPLFKRVALCAAAVGVLYFCLFDTTPRGIECERSASPNGAYIAERCVLHWRPGSNSDYVGRVFDAKREKKLAQHTFSTSVPDLSWSPGGTYYLDTDGPLHQFRPSVGFSRGDGGDDSTYISLPPTTWDRILAARPRSFFRVKAD
jgi:hypothetical protein